ncbi:hypothetical protein [Roseibium album]|uniref:Uncharacterized protein n=1 Tax=Roseibium album TaxID=311410 RepID=A0A0M6Z747_9HYPH|nr:hypothetical protein [Roseibium album]CTQ58141.1 hypothetical protein LA5094_00898 [Roseibium album]CTQ65668.1 hypothetical protein LA5096_00809 [Roseibium album]CTQ70550.1 hypothetical protein LA5095_01953 [Roseibium album]
MNTSWNKELESNKGRIWTLDEQWLVPKAPILRVWDGDIYCDPKEEIELPAYEQNLARFIESVVAANYCGSSGSKRFNFAHQHATDRATGELFDWSRRFIDRERLPANPEDELTVCDSFGRTPDRAMNHLKQRVETPRDKVLQERNLWRVCYLTIAMKCFLARIGYPEFCERRVY